MKIGAAVKIGAAAILVALGASGMDGGVAESRGAPDGSRRVFLASSSDARRGQLAWLFTVGRDGTGRMFASPGFVELHGKVDGDEFELQREPFGRVFFASVEDRKGTAPRAASKPSIARAAGHWNIGNCKRRN